jgi:U3 small nucleolar RNA-associated protein 13
MLCSPLQIKGISELLEGLIPYSQRHFSRVDRLVRSTFLLDYTLTRMSVLDPDIDVGTTKADMNGSSVENGEITEMKPALPVAEIMKSGKKRKSNKDMNGSSVENGEVTEKKSALPVAETEKSSKKRKSDKSNKRSKEKKVTIPSSEK